MIADFDNLRKKSGYIPPSFVAVAQAIKGDRAAALDLLEETLTEQDEQISNIIRFPVFAPMRADPRFLDVLRRINLQP